MSDAPEDTVNNDDNEPVAEPGWRFRIGKAEVSLQVNCQLAALWNWGRWNWYDIYWLHLGTEHGGSHGYRGRAYFEVSVAVLGIYASIHITPDVEARNAWVGEFNAWLDGVAEGQDDG